MLLYRLPTIDDEDDLKDYRQEHLDHGEEHLSASHGLSDLPFADWVNQCFTNAYFGNAEWGRSMCLLCVKKDRIVGLLSIRFDLTPEQAEKYGHIGYGVRPDERNRGYATEMLQYALDSCRQRGMTEVTLGCYSDNAASMRVIEKCGGEFLTENDKYKPGKPSHYYRITL